MPIPFDQIYRDASDARISWQEAFFETLIIDSDGEVVVPSNEKQACELQRKVNALRRYSFSAEGHLLKNVIKRLEVTLS